MIFIRLIALYQRLIRKAYDGAITGAAVDCIVANNEVGNRPISGYSLIAIGKNTYPN